MKRLKAVHIVTQANKDMTGTAIESDSDLTIYKLQQQLKYVVKPLYGMRGKIERALADLDVVTKTRA